MKILVVNCGSSSLKYQLFDMEKQTVLAKGLVERIGMDGSVLHHTPSNKEKKDFLTDIADHTVAVKLVLAALTDKEHGVIVSMQEIDAVGHRMTHGGEKFKQSAVITPQLKADFQALSEMAPLHNPPNLAGVEACRAIMPNVPMVAVFDTAFHQTMPEYAYLYGLRYEAYQKYGLRSYGFHGTSHKYVSERCAQVLGKPLDQLKIITCHLGNGSSLTAIQYGKSVDTSMGFTPLEGLVMGTRSGDLDPAIVPYLMRKEHWTPEEADNYLNKRSGVLGISGVSSDFRDIEEAANAGNHRAQLALDIFAYKVKKFIGSYVAAMNGVDAIVFTAGLGENSISMRAKICENMQWLNTKIDPDKNNVRGKEQVISTDDSKVKIVVIPTNEELMIALDTEALCK